MNVIALFLVAGCGNVSIGWGCSNTLSRDVNISR